MNKYLPTPDERWRWLQLRASSSGKARPNGAHVSECAAPESPPQSYPTNRMPAMLPEERITRLETRVDHMFACLTKIDVKLDGIAEVLIAQRGGVMAARVIWAAIVGVTSTAIALVMAFRD